MKDRITELSKTHAETAEICLAFDGVQSHLRAKFSTIANDLEETKIATKEMVRKVAGCCGEESRPKWTTMLFLLLEFLNEPGQNGHGWSGGRFLLFFPCMNNYYSGA